MMQIWFFLQDLAGVSMADPWPSYVLLLIVIGLGFNRLSNAWKDIKRVSIYIEK